MTSDRSRPASSLRAADRATPNANATSPSEPAALDIVTRCLHLALVVLGVAAWLTGDLADDYDRGVSLGFTVHRWIGIAAALAVALRLVWGVVGPRAARFSRWVPVTKARLRMVTDDLKMLFRFRIPDRLPHQGIAGVVQSIGLVVFGWVSATGVVLFYALEPGARPASWLRLVEAMHEVGEALIPAFLAVHVGATLVHVLAGDSRWRIMFFLKSTADPPQPPD